MHEQNLIEVISSSKDARYALDDGMAHGHGVVSL
jgi:hypothetical protein